jgi:hypothetical protein
MRTVAGLNAVGHLVLLTALLLGDLVTVAMLATEIAGLASVVGGISHVIGELLKVGLLLVKLLPQLQKPLLLALADGVVFGSLLTLLESVTVVFRPWLAYASSSFVLFGIPLAGTRYSSNHEQCDNQGVVRVMERRTLLRWCEEHRCLRQPFLLRW